MGRGRGKTKGFIKTKSLKGGVYRPLLMKQKKKRENLLVIYIAGKRFFFNYDVIVKQKKKKKVCLSLLTSQCTHRLLLTISRNFRSLSRKECD